MARDDGGDPNRVFHLLVADALEALIPVVDTWADDARARLHGEHSRGYADGYAAGIQCMAAEVKDQLVERVIRLRE